MEPKVPIPWGGAFSAGRGAKIPGRLARLREHEEGMEAGGGAERRDIGLGIPLGRAYRGNDKGLGDDDKVGIGRWDRIELPRACPGRSNDAVWFSVVEVSNQLTI